MYLSSKSGIYVCAVSIFLIFFCWIFSSLYDGIFSLKFDGLPLPGLGAWPVIIIDEHNAFMKAVCSSDDHRSGASESL
jgi:hypothetical protein